MNQNSIANKIHDIKDIVQIPDYSIFIFSALVFLALILLLVIVLFIYKYFKNKKKNVRKEYFEILKTVDYKNSKESAYKITKYVRLLAQSNREKKLANDLIESLEKYKYKREVETIDNSIKSKLSLFLDALDV